MYSDEGIYLVRKQGRTPPAMTEYQKPDLRALKFYPEGTLIPLADKAPFDTDWQKKAYQNAKMPGWLVREGKGYLRNVGYRIPPGKAVLDIDPRNDPEGRPADEILAAIEKQCGAVLSDMPRVRTGGDGFHIPGEIPEGATEKGERLEGWGNAVEVKQHKKQVVAAGSVHPETGRTYKWEVRPEEPGKLPPFPREFWDLVKPKGIGANGKPATYWRPDEWSDEVPKRVERLLEGSEKLRTMFEQRSDKDDDSADDWEFGMALLDVKPDLKGWELEEALRCRREVCGAKKGPERKGDTYFKNTVGKMLVEHPRLNGASVEEDFGKFVSDKPDAQKKKEPADGLPKWNARERAMLERLNEKYACIGDAVADLKPQGPYQTLRLMTPAAFKSLYHVPRIFAYYTADLKRRFAPLGVAWHDHWPGRRTYREGIDFLPMGDLGPHMLNLWQGWPLEPAPPGKGSCELFLAHVRDNVCGGDEELYRWVVAWMAHLVQRPWEKTGTAIIMRGQEGVGKGVFANALKNLCGPHGTQIIQHAQLTGKFNAHLAGKLFVYADEVMWGGHKQDAGVLRGLITEEQGMIEAKRVNAVPIRSCERYVLGANEDWVVQAGPTARRFLVLDVLATHREDRVYFGAIVDELYDKGKLGLRALMRFLRKVDLAEMPNPCKVIRTAALADQKIRGLDSEYRWYYESLHCGYLGGSSEDVWPENPMTRQDFGAAYSMDMARFGTRYPKQKSELWTMLTNIHGERALDYKRRRMHGGRGYGFCLPPLEDARRDFEGFLGQELEWPDESEE